MVVFRRLKEVLSFLAIFAAVEGGRARRHAGMLEARVNVGQEWGWNRGGGGVAGLLTRASRMETGSSTLLSGRLTGSNGSNGSKGPSDVGVFVIAMPSRKQKAIENFEKMGIKLGVGHEKDKVVDAVLKNTLDIPKMRRDGKINNARLTDGEIACLHSHLKALQTFLKVEPKLRYGVIFEDDALVNAKVQEYFAKNTESSSVEDILIALSHTQSHLNWTELNLGACYDGCKDRVYLEDVASRLVRIVGNTHPQCAHAYIITRRGAEIFIDDIKLNGMHAEADKGARLEAEDFRLCSLEPRLFEQTGQAGSHSTLNSNADDISMPQYNQYEEGNCGLDEKIALAVGHI